MKNLKILLCAAVLSVGLTATAKVEKGFKSLFDGRTLHGWILKDRKGPGYVVQNGTLVCPENGGGNLFTEQMYENFILRFEFRLKSGSNNGIAIRSPLEGVSSQLGMEIQVLDDPSHEGKIQPWQRHGSLYGVVPARAGALKKTGEWNREEIVCDGRKIRVELNGKTILETDLNRITDREVLMKQPGLLRTSGHIGFLGHDSHVEFRNIRIRELPSFERDNQPPAEFYALFDGQSLGAWKGSVGSPPERAKMTPQQLSAAQAAADEKMRKHWRVENGVIYSDGKGDNLCSRGDFGNFELLVDWKIEEDGDSGIYVRGTPEVQIWDDPVGSGGLVKNEKHPGKPLKRADHFAGAWNRFRIVMIGERIHVFLNDHLVVNNTVFENFWERDKPIYPRGPIELQSKGHPVSFRNIYIRPLP